MAHHIIDFITYFVLGFITFAIIYTLFIWSSYSSEILVIRILVWSLVIGTKFHLYYYLYRIWNNEI